MRVLFVTVFLLFVSCAPKRNDEQAMKQVETIAKADLQVILADMDTTILLDEPFFTVKKMDYFEKSLYSYNAEVDFFFLKDESFRIERKYRYKIEQKKWELYFNEYKYNTK